MTLSSEFARFDPTGRRAVVLSERYAKQLNHPYVTLEHLALALATPGVAEHLDGMPAFDEVDRSLEAAGLTPGAAPPAERVPLDPHVREVLVDAPVVAAAAHDDHVGAEHLLVALLRQESATTRLLVDLGVDPARAPADWRVSPET